MEVNEFDLNKLFCTFCRSTSLDETLGSIRSNYDILYNKIFVLYSKSNDEYICTYNVDPFNTSGELLENTILAHRKKEYNTLYTINALNSLIVKLNGGILDTRYKIEWSDYRNSILLTKNNEFKQLDTKIHKIIFLEEGLEN